MSIVDVLPLLPPDTRITGCVGDGGSYFRFDTTAGAARADVITTCAAHAANYLDAYARVPGREPTTPASYWFHSREGEVTAHLPKLGIRLVLDVPAPFPDVRTDPWVVRGVRIDAYDADSWSDPPNAIENAVAHLRTLANLLRILTPGVL